MTKRICREVDREHAECPKCGKTLTIQALAYKHAKYCQAYEDRIKTRTAKAQEKYMQSIKHLHKKEGSDTSEETRENNDIDMEYLDTESEQTCRETSESTPQAEKSDKSENSNGITFETTCRTQFSKNTSDTRNETTPETLFNENTWEPPNGTTYGTLSGENTSWTTPEHKNTRETAPLATFGLKKTLRVTPGTTLRPQSALDNKIQGMFRFPPSLIY